MTEDFTAVWDVFQRELDAGNRKLRKEIGTCWDAIDALLQKHADLFAPDDWRDLPGNSLSSILEALHGKGVSLLFDPLHSLKKIRSLERAVSAVGKYPKDLEDVLKILPQTLTISRKDFGNCLRRKDRWFHRCIHGFDKKPRTFHVRDTARSVLYEHLNDRIKWDGKMVLLLAGASLSLLVPWALYRNEALNAVGDTDYRLRDLSGDRDAWLERISGFKIKAKRILDAGEMLEKRLPERLAGALLSGGKGFSAKPLIKFRRRWQMFYGIWSARQRAVTTELELEYSSGKLLETAVGISSKYVASIDEEHSRILAELDKVHGWLVERSLKKQMDPFPLPEARLTASEERAASWNREVAAAARAQLPRRVELVETGRIFPDRRLSRKLLEPENCITESFGEIGRETALVGFREAEEGHRAIIHEIERAREVVAYSLEGDVGEEEFDAQVAEEGIQNAVSLMDYQKQSVTDIHPVVEGRLAEALAASFYRFHLAVDESRLGLYGYLVRQKGGRMFRAAVRSLYEQVKTGFRLARDKGIALRDRALIATGWAPPPTRAVEPVVRREYLGELLRLKVVPRELPALYKRLFRLTPVEDPRFLVGRDAEIGAMAQARRQWEEGRPVSILVAGARGSGKTSLLNCAHMAIFNDLPVTNGQFSGRITTPTELYDFLASLFQTGADALHSFLESEKRVVILEEVERTFIRKIGGFRALRTLLDLIAATSKNTLWVLSINQAALNFIENILAFEENFSHRINAMAMAPDDLTEALMIRHNLSGLRLQLMSPEPENSRADAVRRFLGLGKDPERSYFESLYRQSEGIFRSAFELWLQSVDRIEGGVLYMLNPAEPEYGKMLSQLSLDDAFKLQAVLQHGSLTVEETAQIFDEPVESSTRCVDKLIARDVLEKDPNFPGFRVRPSAGRFVRNALYRRNML